jgi:hypothetical protein
MGKEPLALNKPGSTSRFTTDIRAAYSSGIFPGVARLLLSHEIPNASKGTKEYRERKGSMKVW